MFEESVECPYCGVMTKKPEWPNDGQFDCLHCGKSISKTAAVWPPGAAAFVAKKEEPPDA